MKALSIKQPWATLVATGHKTIETRTWPTNYRGEFLIVSSASPRINGLLSGYAVGVARLVDCRPMTKEDEKAAFVELYPKAWAWEVENARLIKPFPVKGSLKLFEVALSETYKELSLFEEKWVGSYLCLVAREYWKSKGLV